MLLRLGSAAFLSAKWMRTGALIFQLCLIASAWLKFAPRESPSAIPPQVNHQDAATVMTTILGLGVTGFCVVSFQWSRGPQCQIKEVGTLPSVATKHLDAGQAWTLLPAVCGWLNKTLKPYTLQGRVKWSFQPPPVGLPFDWHLPPTKRDPKMHTPRLPARNPQSWLRGCIQPSPESPYASLCDSSVLEGMPFTPDNSDR